MSTTQEQLLKAVNAGLSGLGERYPGYRLRLKATLAEVLKLERQHLEQHIDIKVKIRDQCTAAGDLLHRQTKGGQTQVAIDREGAS